jgi:murein L,D-transpeptidase YcbB/YkuD
VVQDIRKRLAEASLKSDATAQDLAALVAFYGARSEPLWITPMGFTAKAQGVIDEIAKSDDWGLSASAFKLPPSGDLTDGVDEEGVAELTLSLAVLKYARFARGGRADPAALSYLLDQAPPLKDPKTVLAEIAAASDPHAYLRSLHPKHEQFQRLRQALLKARGEGPDGKKASDRDVQRILINMERWRWMPEDLGAFYVQDNVPEFMLYVVKNGKTVHADKIVVGKLAYATPIFSSDMRTIVFNPEWTVPPTIVRENLLPSLRSGGGWFGGGSVLREHGLRVRYNGKVVDPGSINWSSVNMANISFTQAPGPTNVLGKLKFLYPNKHVVYMHDTIKPNLFKTAMRAEGHNCIRMERPAKLAEILLAEDKGWDTKKVQDLLAKGYDAAVNLDKPFPVHTTYFTAVVDDNGTLNSFGDVYGLDRKVAAVVLGKSTPYAGSEVTASVTPSQEPSGAPDPKPQAKPKKKDVAAEENLFDMSR